ncbi:MAG: hypothetical protein HY843_03370 [Bdellovibrio sp.]|nr:hypothetical protein [Bdellovibrio sp.]
MWKNFDQPQSFSFILTVEDGDFLDFQETHWLGQPPLGVCSNLPYSSGTAILLKLAPFYKKISFMILMFQEEVAKRLRAQPNSSSWGSLSLWTQNWWDVKKLISVYPNSFYPSPKVNSEVVIFTPKQSPVIVDSQDPEACCLWEQLLKQCFSHRRKMLRSGLSKTAFWKHVLIASKIIETKRAEELTWEEWKKFYAAAIEHKKNESIL